MKIHTPLLAICLALLCFSAARLQAQRYLTPQFTDISMETRTYTIMGADTLALDIYQAAADKAIQRPVLLYVHGGGFAGGTRDEGETPAFAEYLAQRGYVVISMSYRLSMKGKSFSCDQDAPNKIATFLASVEDIYTASQFIVTHQEEWRIDPKQIVLAGSSAGAEAVLHAAYWPKDQLPTEVARQSEEIHFAGVISMAGAIIDLQMITAASAMPTLLFHGTCDNLVPYATAAHHYCQAGTPGYMILHGAKSIADRLAHLGKPFSLFTSCGGQHEWASKPMKDYPQHFASFFYHDVLQKEFRQIHEVIEQESEGCDYYPEGFNYCK